MVCFQSVSLMMEAAFTHFAFQLDNILPRRILFRAFNSLTVTESHRLHRY